MATPEINENCRYVQNDLHRFKIKLEKFHFDILCCFGVIRESLPGGGGIRPPTPGEIGLIQYISKVIRKHTKLNHNHPNCFTKDTLN